MKPLRPLERTGFPSCLVRFCQKRFRTLPAQSTNDRQRSRPKDQQQPCQRNGKK